MSGWTHSLCYTCWEELNPGRQAMAVRHSEEDEADHCCRCGKEHASGIWVRRAPGDFKECAHKEEED